MNLLTFLNGGKRGPIAIHRRRPIESSSYTSWATAKMPNIQVEDLVDYSEVFGTKWDNNTDCKAKRLAVIEILRRHRS